MKSAGRVRMSGLIFGDVLVLVAFAGIISTFLTAAYQGFIKENARDNVVLELVKVASKQHQWRITQSEYSSNADPYRQERDYTTADGLYRISVSNPKGLKNSFVLVATPLVNTVLARDAKCRSLTLDHNYRRGITGVGPLKECWSIQ